MILAWTETSSADVTARMEICVPTDWSKRRPEGLAPQNESSAASCRDSNGRETGAAAASAGIRIPIRSTSCFCGIRHPRRAALLTNSEDWTGCMAIFRFRSRIAAHDPRLRQLAREPGSPSDRGRHSICRLRDGRSELGPDRSLHRPLIRRVDALGRACERRLRSRRRSKLWLPSPSRRSSPSLPDRSKRPSRLRAVGGLGRVLRGGRADQRESRRPPADADRSRARARRTGAAPTLVGRYTAAARIT